MKAALYLRVSTGEQTVENQRDALERIAATRGFEIVRVYEETISGAAKRRPELDAMMRDAHRGCFRIVLIWALDRLGRSMQATIASVLELDRRGVVVVSATESWLDSSGPVRELLISIFAWVAEQERTRLVERTKAGLERARRQGTRLGRPRRLAPVDVSKAQRLRAQGRSVRQIAAELGVGAATLHRALGAADVEPKRRRA